MSIEDDIRNHLIVNFPQELVEDIIDNYLNVKERFYTRRYRDSSFYGGRFAEGVIRILQHITQGVYTPLGAQLPGFHNLVVQLGNLPDGSHHDSLRLFIPKSLDILYDIRNNRNVGHIGGDIDENFADSNLSLNLSSWILAELIRLFYTGDINQAQELVDKLIRIRVPILQDFNGYLRVLNPELPLRNKIMAILFYRGANGITIQDLNNFLGHNHAPRHIARSINRLVQIALVHKNDETGLYILTDRGIYWTEENVPFDIG